MAKENRLLAGRYRTERLLGEGAAGRVWLARDTRQKGSVWAVKEVDFRCLPLDEVKEARKLFHREAAMLKQLEHACLPKVVDSFTENGVEFLVMERVEGPTLESIFKGTQEPLAEHRVAAWGVQICLALEYLHGLNPPVVYRDLKPANVMVNLRGPVKLIDFGIARPMDPSRPGDTTAYGTPGYAPPEQYMGRATPKSDVYALGATLYQLVTRYEPEEFSFSFAPARDHNPELSREIERLLAQMLEKEPEKRPFAADVRKQLIPLAEKPRTWIQKAVGRAEHWWRQNRR